MIRVGAIRSAEVTHHSAMSLETPAKADCPATRAKPKMIVTRGHRARMMTRNQRFVPLGWSVIRVTPTFSVSHHSSVDPRTCVRRAWLAPLATTKTIVWRSSFVGLSGRVNSARRETIVTRMTPV